MSNENLSNAFAIHNDLRMFNEHQAANKYERVKNEAAKWFFSIATYIIYLMFITVSYAAPLWTLQQFIEINSSNYIAIIFTLTLVFIAPAALSLAKHLLYENVDIQNASKKQIQHVFMIVGFFIVSGIYMEITSSTSQQQEKAIMAVDNSASGKAIMNSQVIVSAGVTDTLTRASKEYAACLTELEQKRKVNPNTKFHCNGDKAALDSAKSSATEQAKSASDANSNAIIAKQSALDKERDSHALPIAKMFSDLFGVQLSIGKVIAALIGSLIFEITHSLLIIKAMKLENEEKAIKTAFEGRKVDYFKATGKQFQNSDFNESEVLDLAELRQDGKIKHFADNVADKKPVEQTSPLDEEQKQGFVGFVRPKQPEPQAAKSEQEQPSARSGSAMPRVNPYTIRQALRGGASLYPTSPLDSQVVEKPTYTPTRVDTQQTRVDTQQTRVDTQQTRVASQNDRVEIVYKAFSEIPDYPEGCCKWCGVTVSGKRKYCCDKHRYNYHNLKNPPNKSTRANHG